MPKKKHKPEEIVAKLWQADVLTGQGMSVGEAGKTIAGAGTASFRGAGGGGARPASPPRPRGRFLKDGRRTTGRAARPAGEFRGGAPALRGPTEQHGRTEAGRGRARHEGRGVPMPMRDRGAATLALRRPAAQAGHLGREPAFIDEDQSLGLKVGLAIEPGLARGLHVVALLLAGMAGLFLCVSP